MVLKKLLERTARNPTDNPVLRDVHLSQSFIIARLLAGRLWEGWELIRKAYFSTRLSLAIESKLPDDTLEALGKLKKYFGKKNIIDILRNEFAFHYSCRIFSNRRFWSSAFSGC